MDRRAGKKQTGTLRDKTAVAEISRNLSQSASFTWIDKCLLLNDVRVCETTEKSTNFNKAVIYIFDIIPMMFSGLVKKTWNHRIRELFNKKMQATTAFKERQKITDAAKRLSPWPDSDSENFIDALLNSRELPTNKYRQSLLFLCNTRQNFYLLHDDGGMKETLGIKKMKQIKEKSLDSWDMPFLKNMLLYYCIGPSPESVRPLLKLPNMSDAQWEAQKKIIRDVNDYRNKLLHQQGIKFTDDDLASLKKTFKEFVKKYFGSGSDKALLDKLEKKENELERARFLF